MQQSVDENSQLKAQLKQLLSNAHENQLKLKRFEQIEFKLMAAESIEQLLVIIRDEYTSLFKLDDCALLLEDENLSLRRLIPDGLQNTPNDHFLTLLNFPVELEKLHYLPTELMTGFYHSNHHQWLMNNPHIESIAVMPLMRHGRKIGVFCCGSYDRTRFQAHAACDFYSVCLLSWLFVSKMLLI